VSDDLVEDVDKLIGGAEDLLHGAT
jgi:hypothetical protein